MMNEELWHNVQAFDFDKPLSEHGFSTRIAAENYWTINFTRQAILEYKKFMYLAATSDMMVSPCEIVDTVWHQHLVFTQSYSDFCKVLGKEIKHIPSTHNRAEVEKFRRARERTSKLYEAHFGQQPPEIWACATMFERLGLAKSGVNLRTFLLFGLLAFALLLVPFYVLLKPLYVTIDSADFILVFILACLVSFIALGVYNGRYLRALVQGWNKNLFIFRLTPIEMVFLKTDKLQEVIHYYVNGLVEEGKIKIGADKTLSVNNFSDYSSAFELTIVEALRVRQPVSYPKLLAGLLSTSVFANIANSLNAFKKYFIKSKTFIRLFCVNFSVVAFVFMLGFVRLLTGLARDKPVEFIAVCLVTYFAVLAFYLFRLRGVLTRKVIVRYYEKSVIPDLLQHESNDWNYFLFERAALTAAFAHVVNFYDEESTLLGASGGGGDGGGSGCGGGGGGSGCGSSCSSCGGCGGGD